jgi:hypothetical protein
MGMVTLHCLPKLAMIFMSSDTDDLRPIASNIGDLHHRSSATPVIFTVLSLLRHNRTSTLQNFFLKVDSDAGHLLHLA